MLESTDTKQSLTCRHLASHGSDFLILHLETARPRMAKHRPCFHAWLVPGVFIVCEGLESSICTHLIYTKSHHTWLLS